MPGLGISFIETFCEETRRHLHGRKPTFGGPFGTVLFAFGTPGQGEPRRLNVKLRPEGIVIGDDASLDPERDYALVIASPEAWEGYCANAPSGRDVRVSGDLELLNRIAQQLAGKGLLALRVENNR